MRFRFWKSLTKATTTTPGSGEADVQVADTGDALASQAGVAISGYRGPVELGKGRVTVTGTGNATASHGGFAVSGSAHIDELHIHNNPLDDSNRIAHARAALERFDTVWRAEVRRDIGGYDGGRTLHLAREGARGTLIAAIDQAPVGLIVHGLSGTGKSALIIDAAGHAGRRILGLNLRHLPASPLDLEERLGISLEQALSYPSDTLRVLVVDGADAAAETHSDTLAHILQAAKAAAVTVIVVASEDALGAVRDITARAIGDVPGHRVDGLRDDELNSITEMFSHMRHLAQNAQARDLLRRPIVADLLVRADSGGLPLTDADAMREVWKGLVRRNGRSDRGRPEARERVMKQLARQQLDGQSAEIVLDELDDEAVMGLRRDGLLGPVMELPWQALPTFSHDLLRSYALAQVLLADGQPGVRLAASNAPRWALPAARLACQALLAASADLAGQPLELRFLEVQASFRALATDGFGDRWPDVPSEALLTAGRDGVTLSAAWPLITKRSPDVGARILRLLDQRHSRGGVLDPLVASPIVTCLLDHGAPEGAAMKAAGLIRQWELGLIIADMPVGHELRIRLREQLVGRCREAAGRLEEDRREKEARLAARTPSEVAADEKRINRFRLLTSGGTGQRRRPSRRVLATELTDATTLEQLALLGRDLGEDGSDLLREVAKHAPQRLAPALEEIGTSRALAEFSPELLRTLVIAYYIDDRRCGDGFGSFGGRMDDGIRDHHWRGPTAPLAAYYRGPFHVMLRAGFRDGVSVINRMLNVAAQHRVACLASLRSEQVEDRSAEGHGVRLTLDGTERLFVGDSHVWAWYRGTGVGPYPCMSALQALEFVCDQLIEQGLPPTELVPLLLGECENLAMVGLIVGILIRHCEAADIALDPYLAQPDLWELEFARTAGEYSGLAGVTPGIMNADRRKWSLREVAMTLTIRADGARSEQLRQVGQRLEESARQALEQFRPEPEESGQLAAFEEAAANRLASVRGWAAALDQTCYTFTRRPDGMVEIQARLPDDVVQALQPDNDDLARGSQAYGLINRYGSRWRSATEEPVSFDELTRDIATARSLQAEPTHRGPSNPRDAPAAVAACVIQAALLHRQEVESDDAVWAARLLLDVVKDIHAPDPFADDESIFDWGADRSAARALPLLLLPQAAEIRRALALEDKPGRERLHQILRSLGTGTVLEVKLFLATALDAVWSAPCVPVNCHHRVAMDIVEDSARRCALGEWNPEGQRHDSAYLDGDLAQVVASIPGDRVLVPLLSPGIRASAPASLSGCCTSAAARQLSALLDAHARGMIAHKHQYQHSSSDALVAARALLTLASTSGAADTCRHLTAYAHDMGALAEFLQALAAAAEESPTLADTARSLWPTIMEHVLDLFDAGHVPNKADFRGAQALAALVPITAHDAGFLRRELHGQPQEWTAILDWVPQIERWLGHAAGVPDCVDNLVSALRALPQGDQVCWGLQWLESLIASDPAAIARESWHLQNWLREVRGDAHGEAERRWQRIVDTLTVAGDSRLSDLSD